LSAYEEGIKGLPPSESFSRQGEIGIRQTVFGFMLEKRTKNGLRSKGWPALQGTITGWD